MQSALIAKEQANADTPVLFFDCTLADGTAEHWSSRSLALGGTAYEGRLLRHNLFEAQLASETQIGGPPRLGFELANADSRLSQIEAQSGFKGSRLTVRLAFVDVVSNAVTSAPVVVFTGLMNPPELITEDSFRLSAMNRMSAQRSVVPEVRVQRLCPWRFPATVSQRQEATDGGSRGKYSPFFRCGYSPDQTGGVGNTDGAAPFTDCAHTRGDCEQRGMFTKDSSGRTTSRFGGIEFVPATILVRGSGQKNYSLSAVQDNQARYNDFVPLVYGTQWHSPDVVFSRNDGNLTHMEVLLGMGEIDGILKVLVNGTEIPAAIPHANMTATGWFNVVNAGSRNGRQDDNFTDGSGTALGDPFGSMAYMAVVVPNRVNDGGSVPTVQILMRGLRLEQFDASGQSLGEQFSDNPAWVLLDVLRRSGFSLTEIDAASFAKAAAWAGETISANDPVGGSVQIPRFQCNFALKQRRSSGEIVRAIRNASRIYVVLNAAGQLEARIEGTFALQNASVPPGSNAAVPFNGGWPVYEFGPSSIARSKGGSASVRLSSKAAQDTPNRLSVEFQDSFNQFQQDSLSLSDGDDADLCGQEVAASWDAVGITNFNQAARSVLLALNRGIEGNQFIEFETSVKGLGLAPGDLITFTYAKENLTRAPFRVLKVTPGANFRTVSITAQLHNDEWYSDTVTGIIGGRGWHAGSGTGLPLPVSGTILDANGDLQLGIEETEVAGSDGSADVSLKIAFTAPSGQRGTLTAPLIDLLPAVSGSGGTLHADTTYFYAVSSVDADGGESPLSFIAQCRTPTGADNCSVQLTGIGLPSGAAAFQVYRGADVNRLLRIATNHPPAITFTDTGLPLLPVLPADPQFDHVNMYWRWEMLPETGALVHGVSAIGNSGLQMKDNEYAGALVRITRGTGAGGERRIAANDRTTLTVSAPWDTAPDASSFFVVCETSWRIGAKGNASPIAITVPERVGTGVQISARAANVNETEAAYDSSPLTRWVIGDSGTLTDVPPAPNFGIALPSADDVSVSVFPARRSGAITLGPIGFSNLANTHGITAGTYRFHFYDEVNGDQPAALAADIAVDSAAFQFPQPVAKGAIVQIGQELMLAGDTDKSGNTTVSRAYHGTDAAAHGTGDLVYLLRDKVAVVPFIKGFFGTPSSGDWNYNVELPNVRLASIELYMTNALGDGAISVNPYTGTNDSGLRTLGGGQYSFQITGYLAIQNGAAPDVIVDADRSVRDLYGIVRTPSMGAGVSLQVKLNDADYATIQFAPDATTSNVVNGFGLPPLRSGDRLSLDVVGVGTTNPGSDLTLVMRL